MVASPSAAPASWREEAAATDGRRGRGESLDRPPRTRRPGDQQSAETGTAPAGDQDHGACHTSSRGVPAPAARPCWTTAATAADAGVGTSGCGEDHAAGRLSSEGQRPARRPGSRWTPATTNPPRFWAHALGALCRSGAVPPNSALRSLRRDLAPRSRSCPRWSGGLAELPTPVVLILDDVQELTDARVIQELVFLLRHARPQLRLVWPPADPPLPLQRLRISGQLRSSPSRPGVHHRRGGRPAGRLRPPAEAVRGRPGPAAGAHRRVGGGPRLAALSLQDQPDPHCFVAEFAGDDQSIADYLVGRSSTGSQRSCAASCCGPALSRSWTATWPMRSPAATTASGRWPGWLGQHLRAGARVAWPLYRYHQLFAGLLRCELRRQAPGQVAELHRRAAHWYASHGLVIDATEQTLTAGDGREAADMLVPERQVSLILRGEGCARPSGRTAAGRAGPVRSGARPAGRLRSDHVR